MLPGSARVALVKSATRFGKFSTCSGLGVNLTTMNIKGISPALRNEDGSAADVAVVEIADGGLEVVKGVLLRVQVHRTAGGQRHQIAQVVVGHQVADEVD